MSPTTGISLRIYLKIDDSCELTFQSLRGGGRRITVRSPLSRHQLPKQREQIRKDLEQIQATARGIQQVPRWGITSEATLHLHKLGRYLLRHLFDGDGEKIRQAVDLCQEACPTWDKVGTDQDALRPNMVEVYTRAEDGIPVELLPLFRYKPPNPIKNHRDLQSVAQSFLGFSTIVKRMIRGNPPWSCRALENVPRLPLKFFQYYGLAGARNEAAFFLSNRKHFDLDGDGPWPNKKLPPNFVEILANHLWNPTMGFAGGARQPPDQILHFSCHCDTSAELPSDYKLRLGSLGFLGVQPYDVTLDELEDNFTQLSYDGFINNKARPLVFFSACEPSNLDPAGFGSFLNLFINKKYFYLGCIGPEAAIPDSFAEGFTKQLYRRLLEGDPLGEAIHKVRWEMLRKFLNPLGILYSAYADPEIHVRQPVKEPLVD